MKASQQIERLLALCFILSERLTQLESSNAELRAAASLDPPPPAIGSEWMTVKQAMHATGYSHANVRKLIRHQRLVARKVGGRVLVSTASIAAIGAKKPDAGTDAPRVRVAS